MTVYGNLTARGDACSSLAIHVCMLVLTHVLRNLLSIRPVHRLVTDPLSRPDPRFFLLFPSFFPSWGRKREGEGGGGREGEKPPGYMEGERAAVNITFPIPGAPMDFPYLVLEKLRTRGRLGCLGVGSVWKKLRERTLVQVRCELLRNDELQREKKYLKRSHLSLLKIPSFLSLLLSPSSSSLSLTLQIFPLYPQDLFISLSIFTNQDHIYIPIILIPPVPLLTPCSSHSHVCCWCSPRRGPGPLVSDPGEKGYA